VTDLHDRLREQRGALETLNRRLHEDARRDPLTGLGNRLSLREDLLEYLGRPGKPGGCIALCDIDFFKRYNDREGHLAGDEILAIVAATLRDAVRAGDRVYRYGGEEFLVILPGATIDEGEAAMERIRAAVEDRAIVHRDSDVAGVVTISCGVAFADPIDGKPLQDCIRRADEALYAAKAAGRNGVEREATPTSPAAA
jgi:diguanylate cyclase (GGDEF)-like protein